MINVVDKAMLDPHVIASADKICHEINEENAAKAYLLGEINKWLESKKVQHP